MATTPLGYQTLFELDINPDGSANYVRVGSGLESGNPSLNEDMSQKAYLDGNGGKTTRVHGFQLVYSFAGERDPDDEAQNYIFEKLFQMGSARNTNFRVTGADGTVIVGGCTIANIQPAGGDANSPQACGFELHFNGRPTKTDPVAATALTMTVAAGTVVGTTKATATPGAGNSLGYRLSAAALTAHNREYVEQYTAYTSAANIEAAAGQYLNVYELDAYGHVVKFSSELLEAADIASA